MHNDRSHFKMFLVGGAIGSLAALLMAPKKGSEMREDIKHDLNDILKKASETGQKYSKQAEVFADDLIKKAENVFSVSRKFAEGKYSGTVERFESEYSKLRNAFTAAVDTYKNYGKHQPPTEVLVQEMFEEYDDETIPKQESFGKRDYTKREYKKNGGI